MWRGWCVVAGVIAGVGMGAAQAQAQIPAFWLGAWSPDPECGPQSVAHVFGPRSFELREGLKPVYRGEARLDLRGDILTVRLIRDIENLVEDEDGPRAGDSIAYRKRGTKIRPDTFTRDGLTHANPEFGPEFHRCPN